MAYYEIFVTGDDQDKELAFVEQEPENLGGFGFLLAEGEPTDEIFPDEPAKIYLDPYSRGLRFPSLLGNSLGYLMVCSAIKEIIARHDVAPVEIRPVVIHNHKRRVHTSDFWVINPLATVNCLDRQHSKILYSKADPKAIVAIEEMVFLSHMIEKAPDLFRIPERRGSYFASERLLTSLQGKGFTNIFVEEIKEAS